MSQFHLTNVARGSVIFEEGTAGTMAYLIRSGSVVIHRTVGKQEVVLAHLKPGEVFGEMALVNEGRRTATATAAEDAELVAMPDDQVQQQMQRLSPLLFEVFTAMAMRLEHTSRQVRHPRSKYPVTSVCRLLNMMREINWQERRATMALNDVVEQIQDVLDLEVDAIHAVLDQMAREKLLDWRAVDGKPTGTVHFHDPDTFSLRCLRWIDTLPEREVDSLKLHAQTTQAEAVEAAPPVQPAGAFLDLKTIEAHHKLSFRELRRFIASGELPPDLLHFPAREMLRWITNIREAYGQDMGVAETVDAGEPT